MLLHMLVIKKKGKRIKKPIKNISTFLPADDFCLVALLILKITFLSKIYPKYHILSH